MEFRLIEKDTDISSLKMRIMPWDVVMKDKEYVVAYIEDYMHTQCGKWGDNCYWAWPRDEEPSYENMVEFNSNHTVCWGLRYEESMYVNSKYDEVEMCGAAGAMITRNGKDFYFVAGGMGYSVPKAQYIIQDIQEGVLPINEYGYKDKIEGLLVLYKGWPAIITNWIDDQGCVILEYAGTEEKKRDAIKEWAPDDEDFFDGCMKLDVVGYKDYSIQWFPEYNKNQMKCDFDEKYKNKE